MKVPYFSSSISFEFESLNLQLPSTFVDKVFEEQELLLYMQEVADIAADTPEPSNQPPLSDFQFPELASNDPKLEVVREIHGNLSSAVKWRRAHFRFRSVLAHLYAVRDPMAAGFIAGIVHHSIVKVEEAARQEVAPPASQPP